MLVELGEAMGTLSAAESKEDARQCRALEIRGVRQRVAVQIWRDYQQHINARIDNPLNRPPPCSAALPRGFLATSSHYGGAVSVYVKLLDP